MKSKQAIISALREHITEERAARIHEVIQLRTKFVRVAVEDIQQDRNAGAVIRSCDCFGIQRVSVIENKYNAKVANSISKGSDKWVDVDRFDSDEEDNTVACIKHLKSEGFHVVATSPHNHTVELPDFEITKPTAFLFGTEIHGLSETALNLADERLRIPIYGFTESFNISVSAALVLQQSVAKLHRSKLPWQLSEEEKLDLEIKWITSSIGKTGKGILKKILDEKP
ncbi:TrmH family RNA methyltransferase [Luteibaculum oceani]|uniref:tRNA (guanosine(18)-2'-O)-methyltransferase n=1 Tax=Luteibaculum oceani TaxID=1294296 RepID=A0A5C6UV11_9FLAO|nr:RNA methyltransferase [Luteibaculum oceani]TXC76081.1 RNA methyltransferase [Luteibaculum oceani]